MTTLAVTPATVPTTPGGSDGVGTVAGVTVSVVTPGGSDGVGTVAGVTASVVTPGGSTAWVP